MRFRRNADRYRAGLPHALSPEEVRIVQQADHDVDTLVANLDWESVDTPRVTIVMRWLRRIGGRRLD